MTISSGSEPTRLFSDHILIGFYLVAVLFNLCLVAQVLTVGLAYFYDPDWWKLHGLLVRGYGGLSITLAIGTYLNPFPHRVRILARSLPLLLILQFLTIHLQSPIPLGILHPLIGFSLFSASTTLVHRASQLAFPPSNKTSDPEFDPESFG